MPVLVVPPATPHPLPDRLTGARRALLDLALLVALVASTIAAVLNFVPGHEYYQGGALVETREAGHPAMALWAFATAAGALWLLRRPDRRRTVRIAGGLTLALVAVIIVFIATFEISFDIEWGRRHVKLWPAEALERVMPFVLFGGPALLVLQAVLFPLERRHQVALDRALPRAVARRA